MKDLAYECAKYFAEDAVQVILNINGYSTVSVCQDRNWKFREEMPALFDYELYFAKAVSAAYFKFNEEVKECSSEIWEDILDIEMEKRTHECFRRILQSAPKSYKEYPDTIFFFMAVIGEFCVSCHASGMKHLTPTAILAARCFLTRILKWVSPDTSLNIYIHAINFLHMYDGCGTDENLKNSFLKMTTTRV